MPGRRQENHRSHPRHLPHPHIFPLLARLFIPFPLSITVPNKSRWYNTTYVMFATTTLLLPMSKLGMCPQTLPLASSVEMAVEILEAMDESVVARKSVEIIVQYLKDFRSPNNSTNGTQVATPPSQENADAAMLVGTGTGTEQGAGHAGIGIDIPVCFCFLFVYVLRCYCADVDVFRNGRMGLGFLIIRLMGLHGCLMIWVGFLCWIIDSIEYTYFTMFSQAFSRGMSS